ncbi:hypothetical protein Taro_049968 [Colocasia esculenta]|uniref:Uncharacterized protein n=1 Tax=Colocasia esculenta TaxID=4460 RepID=A0A843XCL0_COLES|nr:hypothetical protein [Colocasia esculenta]
MMKSVGNESLTHLWSTSRGRFVQVAADEKGKKKSFLWSFHSSSATKSSSTRPYKVLKLVPKEKVFLKMFIKLVI